MRAGTTFGSPSPAWDMAADGQTPRPYHPKPAPWLGLTMLILLAAVATGRADEAGYEVRGDGVYFGERVYVYAIWSTKAEKMPQADGSTFQILGKTSYGKDARNAFYQRRLIPGADPASFSVLAGRGANRSAPYSRDREKVYLEGFPIPGADPASFQLDARRAGLARDRRAVYLRRTEISGADPATYEPLAGEAPIGRDRSGWFYGTERVAMADPGSFAILDADAGPGKVWARDAKAVYIGSKSLASSGPAKVAILAKGYTRDAKRVYYQGDPIPGADPATFTVRVYEGEAIKGDTYVVARDRRHFYTGGMATGELADGDTFEELGRGYARDSRRVYFLSRVVEGADPASFSTAVVRGARGPSRGAAVVADKNRLYQAGHPLGPR